MYCIKCGVQLADTEARCPLCQTEVYHPALAREEGEPLYPTHKKQPKRAGFRWYQIPFTAAYLLPLLILLLCDLQVHRQVTWSGYVIGGLLVGYVALVLPSWFEKPNPVIFVPCGFAALGLYLLYIDLFTGGRWFLPFALPLLGGVLLTTETVVVIHRYVKKGLLYLYGGASIALGGLMLLAEFLLNHTFGIAGFFGWSLYPLIALALLGMVLLFLAICRPAREMMERKFFI